MPWSLIIIIIITAGVAALVVICMRRMILCKGEKTMVIDSKVKKLDKMLIASHLSGAIKIKTVSYMNDEDIEYKEFERFHNYLRDTYPNIHNTMIREKVLDYSLIYRWPGTNPKAKPCLLMAHMDVVPVSKGSEKSWKYEAFSGNISDGYIWGRGTIDMKGQLIAIMEACETLISRGFKPSRDIYIAMGHNEERMRETGAMESVRLLTKRSIRFEYVLDEGGRIFEGKPFGVEETLAAIGVCEKGYADIALRAEGEGGHASTPPKHTALGKVCEAVTRIEANPVPYRIKGPTRALFDTLAPHMKPLYRFLFVNLWLFSPLVKLILKRKRELSALMHTTLAPTMASASKSSNVLPQSAEVIVNARIAPWDSVEEILDYIQTIVGSKLKVTAVAASEPSPVTNVAGAPYKLLAKTINRIFPDLLVVPYIMVAATDSRFYTVLCDNVLRFVPFRSMQYDIAGMHGVNERLSLDSLEEGVRFFIDLIENS